VGVTSYGILAGIAGPGAGLVLFAGTSLIGGVISVLAIADTRQAADSEPALPASGISSGPAKPDW